MLQKELKAKCGESQQVIATLDSTRAAYIGGIMHYS